MDLPDLRVARISRRRPGECADRVGPCVYLDIFCEPDGGANMITITIRGAGIHHDAALMSEEDVDIAERILARIRSRMKPNRPSEWVCAGCNSAGCVCDELASAQRT